MSASYPPSSPASARHRCVVLRARARARETLTRAQYNLEALTSVRATNLDEHGLALEAVMCDGDGCVCTLETVYWPCGRVESAQDAMCALRGLVDHVGLDGNVLTELNELHYIEARQPPLR